MLAGPYFRGNKVPDYVSAGTVGGFLKRIFSAGLARGAVRSDRTDRFAAGALARFPRENMLN